jgi:hypothetical protein
LPHPDRAPTISGIAFPAALVTIGGLGGLPMTRPVAASLLFLALS